MITVIYFKNGYERFVQNNPQHIPLVGDRVRIEDEVFIVTQKTFEYSGEITTVCIECR